MRLTIELELEADYHENTDATVVLEFLSFPGSQWNMLAYLSPEEREKAQEALEDAYRKDAIDKAEALLGRLGERLGTYRSPRTGT